MPQENKLKEISLNNFSLPTQANWPHLRLDSSKVHFLIRPVTIILRGTKLFAMLNYLPKRLKKKSQMHSQTKSFAVLNYLPKRLKKKSQMHSQTKSFAVLNYLPKRLKKKSQRHSQTKSFAVLNYLPKRLKKKCRNFLLKSP